MDINRGGLVVVRRVRIYARRELRGNTLGQRNGWQLIMPWMGIETVYENGRHAVLMSQMLIGINENEQNGSLWGRL
jgi:hypothetical protein